MMRKGVATLVVLLAWMPAYTRAPGQASKPAAAAPQTGTATGTMTGVATLPGVPQGASANTASGGDCVGANCDYQPPHISISTAAPAAAPWPVQERIAWGANIVLVILGYVGVMMAVSLLRKIERQTRYGEEAAEAAAQSAKAALVHAEAMVRAERPWVLVTAEPTRGVENSFTVTATNRGRSPAKIVSSLHEFASAMDEASLPKHPEMRQAKKTPEVESVILLPGESTSLVVFGRDDVAELCKTEERIKRVEEWEEKVYLYGKITYIDLTGAPDAAAHESGWCCWYIHGRLKSGMVMAGPPSYNAHT